IAGYAIGETIHTGANLQQHRATRMVDKKTFTIKQLKSQHPSKEDVAKLYMEYDITSNISTGAVNRVLDIEVINNTPVIFEETLSAGTLKSWLHKNSMGVNDLIGFSIGLAESIDTIHRQQLVYNGICPDNLFWDPYLKTVQLTDFFLSSNIAVGAFMSLQDISSHLIHYISPEQTGRISSRVDARSDLYAIGALMYELLTGDSYIKADNIHDIIYQITCIEPAHPTSIVASTPAMLADIILKLLSKNSADRYQTAAGLIFDLKKCQAALSQEGEIPHFPLAQHDQLANIVISKDFCGRNEEVHILREAITRAAFGSSEVVLVAGEPGVGKTTLANEMAIPVIAMKGYFMSAKYQQLRSMKSYAIIKSLLEMLNGQLQVEGKDSILALKETLTEVLAADSVVILELLPEIKWLLPAGKTAAGVEKLDPIEAKIRFDRVIIDFFRVLAREAHPLTCYIDDIQWSDSASMELINKLMADASVKYITFIFGYRDNELAPNSPTLTRIESASQNPATTIKLLPFNEEQVKTLIATTVKLDHDSLAELSAIMMTKTLGNPFYIFEVLTEMAAHNVFSYHEASGYWRWDTQKVQAMNISANVVEFISKRLSVLSEFEIKVVKTMALMGVITDIPMLALLCDCSHKALVKAIWKLVEIAVLVPLENTINTLHRSIDFVEDINSQQSSGLVRFSHDKSQQAAYDLDSESERKKRHLAIARTLFEHTPSQDLENKSTLIANQYNHALQLIDDSA
ncbi:MAG: AAA family ATPase, partial [Bermanella sp.]